ncbi:alpha-glucosidase [Fulvitalea axinellae]|uniref:Alpha-glucosidase n=1 Tax=Fulvitalea axinellae TaxID=1182444 RepID=A0AAU9CAX5_9BACT|nr:alpha-glucosidase [Fulvitalea axinellae]
MKTILYSFFALVIGLSSCSPSQDQVLSSPDQKIKLTFDLENSVPTYSVTFNGEQVVTPSKLGFVLADADSLTSGFEVYKVESSSFSDTWEQVWGEDRTVENNHNEMLVGLREKAGAKRELNIRFRAFDDGVGFRYEFPKQKGLGDFVIMDEKTEFRLGGDYTAWWIPQDFDSYEKVYHETPVHEVKAVNTPVTFRTEKGTHLSIHEAALTDYAGMTLAKTNGKFSFEADLVPWADGSKVKTSAGAKTPWRTIQIGADAGSLVESKMILNLNEPNKLTDVSWIKPMKYVGIWWGMHLGTEIWAEGPRHGATTENAIRHIDFAKKHNIGGLVVEGWNAGWDKWGQKDAFDHVTPAKDFDFLKVAKYAKDNGVQLIGHNETGGDIPAYEHYMDSAFTLYRSLGMNALKTGYAGGIYPRGEKHHGQFMVRHYRHVVKKAADYNIMLDAHEPIKPTGIRRTYPNMMTREGVRGMEWNAWSEGNGPDHLVILPFTRMLGGPIDYTPGIFDILFENSKSRRVQWNGADMDKTRIHTTLAKQLAAFVVIYSPLQMASDLVENYEGHPAFQFIMDCPTDWEQSKVLNGEVGQYITMARQGKDGNWYLGSMTDEKPRDINVTLDFLEEGKTYEAQIYADAPETDLMKNPTAYRIEKKTVKKGDKMTLSLKGSGGQAMVFKSI